MNYVHRSTHKQNRWLSCGPYRQPVRIDWRSMVMDVIIGGSIGSALLVFGLKILQGVAL